MLGARGSGRTSFLRRLAWSLETAGLRAIFVNGGQADSAHALLGLIRSELPAPDRPPASAQAAGGGELLMDDLRALGAALPETGRTVVILDDVPSPEDARRLFGRLRDELWELPLAWAVGAPATERATFVEPPADAFWTKVVSLPPLDPRTATELLTRRLEPGDDVRPEDLAALVVAADGNPRRLLSLAYDVTVGGEPPARAVEERRRRDELAGRLGPSARRLLDELEANGPASASDRTLLGRLNWSRGRAAQVFKQLEDAGLVTASDQPGKSGRPRRVYEVAP